MPGESAPRPEDVVLRLSGITKRFGALVANDDVSLELRRGEVLALLGENGAGKTTLMNILFGHYVADSGAIEAFGEALNPGSPRSALTRGIGMVHQHFTLAENLTVVENIMLGTEPLWSVRSRRQDALRRVKELSHDFGLAVEPLRRVGDLSVGERQRVEILKALYRNARILILDEPTAVLTPQETEALFATLNKLTLNGLAIIFISHKLNEVISVCTRIAILRQGRLVAVRAKGETDRHELAELMVGRPVSEPKAEPTTMGPIVLSASGLNAIGVNRALTLHDVDFELRGGEILGVAGVSGNGQSSLAEILTGMRAPAKGTLTLFGDRYDRLAPNHAVRLGIARIPEDRHDVGMIGDLSVEENLVSETYRERPFSRNGIFDWTAVRRFALAIIEKYDVRCPGPRAPVRLLSGGNMQKLILGREIALRPSLILANQPTRGLDVGAVTYVHQQLLDARSRGAGILLISEDLDELLALSDRIVVMYRGQMSHAISRSDVTVSEIGLMMAGHGFADGARGHAA